MSGIPSLDIGSSGAIPTPPATLNQNLIAQVVLTNPGYTANLPGSLIEDISSTDTGALVMIDQARVDAVNSLSPISMGPYTLSQFGQQTGIPQGLPSNTSALVVFSGPVGQVVQSGFVVSDGTHQYTVQTAVIIGSNGQSANVLAVAIQSGIWTPAANSITTLVTAPPPGVVLTVTNPLAGTAGSSAESVASYRTRLLEAQKVTSQGVGTYLRTLLKAIPGVNARLVSVLAISGGWEILCGGGDPYQVVGAIYLAVGDLSRIVGSITSTYNVTVSLIDGPDSYAITYVNPPAQTVTVTATWNTTLPNFTNGALVNQYTNTDLNSYLNSLPVGAPINELEMTAVFQDAVISILSGDNLTTLTFLVYINGSTSATPPSSGTSIIPSPVPEGYWTAASNAITVVQG